MTPPRFTLYLGTHEPSWIGRTCIPLFLGYQRLKDRHTLGSGRWALDSGGFSELSLHGAWTTTPCTYVAQIRHLAASAGLPDFCAIQDWMCETAILRKTGLSVKQHQEKTLRSYLDLRAHAPELPWLAVLQGWHAGDYLDHAEQYAKAGIDLTTHDVVGVGSVCRRQKTDGGAAIMHAVAEAGIKPHGFGFKLTGLRAAHHVMASSDSMAWSFIARRRQIRLEGHTHKTCNNCLTYAERWYRELLTSLPASPPPRQLTLEGVA